MVTFLIFFHVFNCLIYLSADMEENPGPGQKSNAKQWSSICLWNLNSIPLYDVLKIQALTLYNYIHNIFFSQNVGKLKMV